MKAGRFRRKEYMIYDISSHADRLLDSNHIDTLRFGLAKLNKEELTLLNFVFNNSPKKQISG